MNNTKKSLSPEQQVEQIKTLQARFERSMSRHSGIDWGKVQVRLEANPKKLWSLHAMDQSGGEPDVIALDDQTGEYIFYDCSAETPEGRRNVCYDREAQDSRKKFAPERNAIEMATEMGAELLTEEEYRELQKLGEFDIKTSSWIKTPPEMRKLDGALFADRRYGRVFVYHNSAPSYYGVRGFRASLRV